MDDEQLILLVQANELIYNKYCPGYKNQEKKKNVWRQISAEMNVPEEMCIKRWTCLRDRYAREKRQENLPSGSGMKLFSSWPFMQVMEFLAPHIVPRTMRCSYNILEESLSPLSVETDTQLSPPHILSQSPVSLPSPMPAQDAKGFFKPIDPSPTTAPIPKRKRNTQETAEDNSFTEALGAFKTLCENKTLKEREEEKDPLHGFGKMIVATIATMNPNKQIRAMQRVTALVMEMKLEPDD